MAEAPLSLTDGTSFEKKKKKIAEPVTRNNALAWRQPFCTTSGGTDRHREALALSWHRPDPRLGVVTDSQAGACHAWRLSLLTSVHTIALPSSAAGPEHWPWDLFLCYSTGLNLPPPHYVLIWHCCCVCCSRAIIYPFGPCSVVRHDLESDVQTQENPLCCI